MLERKEFFGVDLQEALRRASARLGLPVEQLEYQELAERFVQPLKQPKVGILVAYDPERIAPQAAGGDSQQWLAELETLADQPHQRAARILQHLLAGTGHQAEVTPAEKGEQVLLTVRFEGEPPDTRRGEFRELRSALQYLVNRIQSKGAELERRYIVDFGGDMEARAERIGELARELAAKVTALGQPIQIGLMDPQDRRLLHLALVDDGQVTTHSEGQGRFRVLCIEPREETPDE